MRFSTIGVVGLVIAACSSMMGCAAEAVGDPDEPPVRTDGARGSQSKKENPPSQQQPSTSSPAPSSPTPPQTPPEDPPRPEDPPTPPEPPAPPPATTTIVSNAGFQASSRCIDAPAGNMDPGVTLVAWPCHLESNQRFSLQSNGMLKSQNGNCVDIPSGKTAPILWMCHGGVVGDNQRWTYDGKTLRVMGKCLAVRGDSVLIETCNGSAAQKWTTVVK